MEDKLLMAFTGNPFNFVIKVAKDTKMGCYFFFSSTYFIHIPDYKKKLVYLQSQYQKKAM